MQNSFLKLYGKWILVFLAGVLLAAIPSAAFYFSVARSTTGRNEAKGPVPPPHAVHRVDGAKLDGTPEPKPEGKSGIRIYYDGVHGARHLFNRDNRRYRTDYHTISGWYRLLQGLRTAGYSIDAEDYACFDAESLKPYQVFMIGEETYHARFMTDDEQKALIDWVRNGGGLFITVEHTNAHYMGDVFNTIMKDLPVKARFDSICDKVTADPASPDWVSFPNIVNHPVTEGVHDYSFDNGCSLDTEFGVMLSTDEAWSDKYDPKAQPVVNNGNKRRDEGELGGPLVGVAAFEYGKGRVVVIGDHNALTNTSLYQDDHHRFAMNAVRWLAHAEDRNELVNWQYPSGYDLFIHTGAGSEFNLHKKNKTLSYRTAYGFLGKEPQLRPWANKTLRAGDEVLYLAAPTIKYTDEELKIIDQAVADGEPIIWLATNNSINSEAAKQLEEKFGFSFTIRDDPDVKGQPFEIHGPEEWTHGIYRAFVMRGTPDIHVVGLDPIVQLTWGSQHIEDKQWEKREILIDLVSSKDVGNSKFYVITVFDIFDDRGLNELYVEGADVVRQQMAELVLRSAKIAAHDTAEYID
jgi:hypothetical protein